MVRNVYKRHEGKKEREMGGICMTKINGTEERARERWATPSVELRVTQQRQVIKYLLLRGVCWGVGCKVLCALQFNNPKC